MLLIQQWKFYKCDSEGSLKCLEIFLENCARKVDNILELIRIRIIWLLG